MNKIDKLMEGFNFAMPDDRARLRKWIENPLMGTGQKKVLLIVGPKASGKTTLANRLMEYCGEEPRVVLTRRRTLYPRGVVATRDLAVSLSTKKIVVFDCGTARVDTGTDSILSDLMTLSQGFEIAIRRLYTDDVDRFEPRSRIVALTTEIGKLEEFVFEEPYSRYVKLVRLVRRGKRSSAA